MRKVLIGAVAALFLCASLASATAITFTTPTGALANSESVSAQAVVTTSSNTVTVALSNLTPLIHDAGQLLSDFSFTLSGGTVGSTSVTSGSGNLINIGSGGTVTSAGSTTDAGWVLSTSGSAITLEGLGGTNGPAYLVVGPPCVSGTYCNANSSIAGNGPHNPVFENPLTFTLDVPGVTSATTASNAVFSFSTTAGVTVNGVVVPEPASLGLFGIGLLGLAFLAQRKSSRAV